MHRPRHLPATVRNWTQDIDPLMPVPESLSPKLKFLRDHHLRTIREEFPRGYLTGHPNDLPWTCHNSAKTIVAHAATEDEAILSYCERTGIPHYLAAQETIV